MAYLRSSSITVAGPPGNHTPFRFSRSSTCHRRRSEKAGQGWGGAHAILDTVFADFQYRLICMVCKFAQAPMPSRYIGFQL